MSVASPSTEQQRAEEPSSLTRPYLSRAPSGVAYVGTPLPPKQPRTSQVIYLPVHSVTTSAGGAAHSSEEDSKHLFLTAATGGFKVEWAKGERGEVTVEPILIRDSRKNMQSIVFDIDQSPTAPTAKLAFTLAAIDGTNNSRTCTVDLDLLHPAYSVALVEKLKVLIRSWQQKSPSPVPAIVSPLLALAPSDLRPPPKPEGYNAADSSTWVGPFPPPVASPGTLEETEAERAAKKKKKKSKTPGLPIGVPKNPEKHAAAALAASVAAAATAPKLEGSPFPEAQQPPQAQAGPSGPGQHDLSVPDVSDGEPIYWNDTGRQRRKSTLGVKSYAVESPAGSAAMEDEEHGLAPPSDSGIAPSAGRASSAKAPPSITSPATSTSTKRKRSTSVSSSARSTSAKKPNLSSATPSSSALPLTALPPLPGSQAASPAPPAQPTPSASASTSAAVPPSSTDSPRHGTRSTGYAQQAVAQYAQQQQQPRLPQPDITAILSQDRERVTQLYTYVSQLGTVVTQVAASSAATTAGQSKVEEVEKRCKSLEEELKMEREARERLEEVVKGLVEAAKGAKGEAEGKARENGEVKAESVDADMDADEGVPPAE